MSFLFASNLTLPDGAATQTFALMGRRGSGKTYAAGKLVEGLYGEGDQVIVLDPVGVWWGLRLSADGTSPGLAIAIIGGQRGDIPIEPTAGVVIARTLAESYASAVLDLSEFTGAEQRRFVADFATTFLQSKKSHRSPCMVVWEEAQEFAPQRVMSDSAKMVGAVERMVKLGRNFGIGTTLVSQRPQAVNKDVLNQTEVLLAFQLNGVQERKAIDLWVQEHSAETRSLINMLPGLPQGEAFLWSPQWLHHYAQVRILPKATYDASATPDERVPLRETIAELNLDALREAMAATIEKAQRDDPKVLRAQVTALQRKLETWTQPEVDDLRVEVAGLRRQLADVQAIYERALDSVSGAVERARGDLKGLRCVDYPPSEEVVRVAKAVADRVVDIFEEIDADAPAARPGLVKAERQILTALAQYPHGRTISQLAILTGYRQSGGFRNALSSLRQRGLLTGANRDTMTITASGVATLGPFEPLPTGSDLFQFWMSDGRLGKAEKAILSYLASRPGEQSGEAVAEQTGYQWSGGFRNALSKLRTLALIVGHNAAISLAPELRDDSP